MRALLPLAVFTLSNEVENIVRILPGTTDLAFLTYPDIFRMEIYQITTTLVTYQHWMLSVKC